MARFSPRPGSSLAALIEMSGFLFGATAMFAAMYETQAILPTVGRDFGTTPSETGLTVSLVVVVSSVSLV